MHETEPTAATVTKIHTLPPPSTGGGTEEQRIEQCEDLVKNYYDNSTDFYLFGWGQSFHFGRRFAGEGFQESLKRHEYWLAHRLGLSPGQRALDLGCGVGGPARNIARFSGASVVGVNMNEYQIARGNEFTAQAGLADQVSLAQGNFMDLTQFPEESFDAAYAIEATCHAPSRTECFKQVARTLKPGGVFGGYEWVMTDAYDPKNPLHVSVKDGIEVGNGLPYVTGADDVREALEAAGFDVEELCDLAPSSEVAWYDPFVPRWTVEGWKTTPLGILMTNKLLKVLEFLRIVPAGSVQAQAHLLTGAATLRAGGEQGIFTPMLFFLARKRAE